MSIHDLTHLITHNFKRLLPPGGRTTEEPPLRSELFSNEQLQRHARELAGWHEVNHRPDAYALLRRLSDNAEVLAQAHALVTASVAARHRIAPAAEWLLDNYYLIEEQLRICHRHLPPGYIRRLLRLANGPHQGLPRVYAIATELIAHTDGRVDIDHLNRFVASYQTVATLTLGELWAIPIMLRLALIENLRRVAVLICDSHRECDSASQWFTRMVAEKSPTGMVTVVADMVREKSVLSTAFVAEFSRRVQSQSLSLSFATVWIEQCLAASHLTIDQQVLVEHQRQAASQTSIANSVTSMRTLSAIDWRDFVEGASVVEIMLRGDPAGIYAAMDFSTRDRYRHAVEELSRRSHLSEQAVAQQAITLAKESPSGAADGVRRQHVGFFLIDDGRIALSQRIGVRPTMGMRIDACGTWLRLGLYLGPIAVITTSIVVAILTLVLATGWHADDRWLPLWLTLLGLGLVISVSQTALACVNWLATQFVHPHLLPRLDYRRGIPPDRATLVVIPTMIRHKQDIDSLIAGLEVRYLGNPDDNLYFALLTDFTDSPNEIMAGDEALLTYACTEIQSLNDKHHKQRMGLFYLFHRPRRWNARERVWMGEERKRGKLSALNRLLRHGERQPFMRIVGDVSILADVVYVITLDTDTQLPREEARKLVGTMAHPLNRAVFDVNARRVIAGYGVLQPRVAISLPSTSRSWFARIFAGEAGIDPYTRAVSDVYQDVFGEGSFIGKGIYDISAFAAATGGCFPDNTILSHDLLEGCYARSGLVSDVLVIEDQPTRYLADVARRHRWIRGDWQNLWWLLPRVPALAFEGATRRMVNPLPALAHWKILDNLRRSLVSPALLAILVAGLTVLPGQAWWWTILVLALLVLPAAISTCGNLLCRPKETSRWMHLHACADGFAQHLAMAGFTLVFLPYEAYVTMDAICRSWWRICISHRRRLEWQTASDSELAASSDLVGIYIAMWIAPTLALAAVTVVWLQYPVAIPTALPMALAWALSPAIAWWLSRPLPASRPRLTVDDRDFLCRLSRRTWRFFETFVSGADHWLPPDNFQEYAIAAPAHRTSPTNIGLALLSNLAARDFGYLTISQFLERCEQTTVTMRALERHRGHFFNWYDTQTLEPMLPRYISTVDSSNLAGHLVVLRAGLAELPETSLHPGPFLVGLRHTVLCLAEAISQPIRPITDTANGTKQSELTRHLRSLETELANQPATMSAAFSQFERLIATAETVAMLCATGPEEQRWWAAALVRECLAHRDELAVLMPWCTMDPLPSWQVGTPDQRRMLNNLQVRLVLLDKVTSLREIAGFNQELCPELDQFISKCTTASIRGWLGDLRSRVQRASEHAALLVARSEQLARSCTELADMELSFLYDPTREQFAIGFNLADGRIDRSYYDLLASEARLGSFIAVAQGRVAQDHWFALGRQLTISGSSTALLSWSGSMFEYLMPELVMPTYSGTLLDLTNRAVVQRQIAYGKQRGVPWGISESGYNRTDAHLTYQYRAFGVPGLGFKRGLADDLVIAPYASALALMIEPQAACANLRRLSDDGHEGIYGMYEAIDYTPVRLTDGATKETVQSYMAHHQGMSLLAFAHVLLDKPMQRRFSSDPQVKTALLLLQERAIRAAVVVQLHASESTAAIRAGGENESAMRVFTNPIALLPEVHLLSNGRYHVMVGVAGGGYSRWKDLAINRWREDPTREAFGMFCYLRDSDRGAVWSNTYQPTLQPCTSYEAIFTKSRAEFRRRDHDIDVHTQISVSPEDDIELRRITLINRSRSPRVIELTSYTEVVDAPQSADAAHPAFSNLFVQTAIDRDHRAILCSRRARSADERPAWMFHLMTMSGTEVGQASYETDRMRFIGRGNTVALPLALIDDGPLSDSAGSVLDPVASIRRHVLLQPDEEVDIDLVFGMADSRKAAEALIEKYHEPQLCERVFGLSLTHSQVVLRQLGASEADAQLYGRLAGAIIHPTASRRAAGTLLARNHRSQAGLWAYGISGDLPIVLVRIGDGERIDLVRELLRAHVYWRAKGLIVDLVIWNEDHSIYRQTLHDQIASLIVTGSEDGLVDRPGGIFVRRSEQMTEEDRVLLQTVARVVITDGDGTLAQFADRLPRPDAVVPRLSPIRLHRQTQEKTTEAPADLLCANGLGGFTRDGREYIIVLEEGVTTPLPWVNVLANPEFGSVISESGGAYTWAGNSHEYRLTTWHNDPVSDPSGEAFYLRDEDSGRFWSPTPSPARGSGRYVVRHGFGYSAFLHEEDGLACEMMIYVAIDAPVKLVSIKIRNSSQRQRRLSLTGFWEWVLGEQRQQSAMHIVTEVDHTSGILTARNSYHAECGSRLAFVAVSDGNRSVTGDRAEFLGRNGDFAAPAAMSQQRLSGRVGAGLDPCAALHVPFELADDEIREIVFVLGAADGIEQVRHLALRFCAVEGAHNALKQVWQHWNHTLGAMHVETPDPAVNVLANGWLVYQTIACRMWARSGFYQSGGAYGFRDQLQDAMALVHVAPWLLREHILRAAAHQFREGDVQHWWHPPDGRGVRTHFSDDYLWLPYAVARYCSTTGDTGVLEEMVPFIEGRAVRADEDAYYDKPVLRAPATLYEHCTRAIDNGLRWGSHGLPLMGGGDWNDGMNQVGAGGRGESVWLAFFLHDVLAQFAPVAHLRGEKSFAEKCQREAAGLKIRIEANAWDGAWYRRAYFDDGTPLGSVTNTECQIDSLPQSWAVLSGAADTKRARMAMEEVDRRLVNRADRLIRLFTPAFDHSELDPGYIKGYVPGVRENGGQYTHAAIWTAMAFAQIGDTERAWELWSLINPVANTSSAQSIAIYKAEPYVVAADVYALAPHTGRGGWTWYTGSAGWMYRLLTESLLGLHLEPGRLRIEPQLPAAWSGFTVRYRFCETHYHIHITRRKETPSRIILDGVHQNDPWIPLIDDRRDHDVRVEV